MSSELTVGKRYAKALFESAKEHNQIDQIEEELKAVSGLFTDSETGDFFAHPSIGTDSKLDVLNKALTGKVSEMLLNTLRLLVERRRESALAGLAGYYSRLVDEHHGRATAIVYTPMPLTDAESRQVAEHFGKVTGKTIRVENVIDKSLLGGLQVRIGDRLYDGSLSGKLAGLKKILA
mgnify:CR=1 FL=1